LGNSKETRWRDANLFNVESRANVDDYLVGVGELALDVEGVGERDENVFFI